MARIRTIKPEFPQSESMGRVSREARLLFVMLWTICDDEGRGRGSSRMLASLLFPYDEDAPELIDGWMGELEKESCVVRYQGPDGAYYFASINWAKHQRIDKPGKSKCPAPTPENILESSKIIRERSRPFLVGSRKGPEEVTEGKDLSPGPSGPAPERVAFPSPDDKSWLFSEGRQQLESLTGKPADRVRSLVGKWLKELSENASELRAIIEDAAIKKPVDPVSWITAAVAERRNRPVQPAAEDAERIWSWRVQVYSFWRHGLWPPDGGDRPDEPGCRVPKCILAEFGPLSPAEKRKARMPAKDDPPPKGWGE